MNVRVLPLVIAAEQYCSNSCVPNKEEMRADFASEKASIPLQKSTNTKMLSGEQTAAAAVESQKVSKLDQGTKGVAGAEVILLESRSRTVMR